MTRLPAPDVTAREFWTSERMATALVPAVGKAEHALGTPWPEARASQFARFWRDGDRKEYEGGVIARQRRLTYAAVAALHTGEERFLDEVVDGVILLCEQSTWCWAAHDHTNTRNGYVVADVTDPCLDLGAGEVAAQLAWVDHLLGPAIDDRAPGVRARIRYEAQRRVLRPFTDRRDWWWLGIERPPMNWTVWIQGNVLAAALALEDDTARRRHIIQLVAEGVGRYWDSLPPDGGVDEGYHYWWQGAARALEAEDLLGWAREQGRAPVADAPAGDAEPAGIASAGATPGATSRPGHGPPSDSDRLTVAERRAETIRQVVAFPHRMHLGGDWYVGVADSPARPIWAWPWNLVHSWARRVGDEDAARHAASYRGRPEILWDERVTLSRAVLMLSDDEWAVLPSGTAPPLVGEVRLPETQVALARSRPGSAEGVAVFVKGGHNGENHNHNDVGEVLVALDGMPVVVDAGKPTYRAGTFGEGRYEQWPMRSAWHNVPLIRGREQSPGPEFAARSMTVAAPGADAAWTARLDLAGAYGARGSSWWREVTLDRAAESVTVRDDWSFADDEDDGPTALHWLLAGDVELDAGAGCATVRHAAGRPDAEVRTLRISWDQEAVDAGLEAKEIDDDELGAVWGDHLTRLSLTVRKEMPVGTLEVRFDAA
ncbi:heparinase II/III domain-containing protein [Myceligenerans pegani]|uniref:Heparinase II/III family protein n=1 Tax=Myceligenerans pegani TaxID=2776917 RepID=A0ABR9N4Y0_9MICO|nr:heparinase II/III family protein [Myceligenerans sp. TRM 65318]MBE1878733.1 heparinase II/III family protein [Myceligenerans sp. TRM 65318]MBE3021004.1 heparinase II/III family protein [Myceligenerans sp. TRM 65318]